MTDNWSGTGKLHHGDVPLAVPDLAIAAQLLGRPLPMVERAAQEVEPYRHTNGWPVWSLKKLAIALGLVESREARRRGRAPERAAS
jgi:hypothetical protein